VLQRAFQNIYDTMDTIDKFKLEALGNMKQTVDTLGREVEKSRGYIARAEGSSRTGSPAAERRRIRRSRCSRAEEARTAMNRPPRGVDHAIARFDEVMNRIDRGAYREAQRRQYSRSASAVARRIGNVGMAIGVLIAATITFGLVVGPIGIGGLFAVAALMFLAVLLFAFWPGEKPIVDYKEDMPNKAVVQRLDSLLVRKRAALPAPAARRIDAISAQLPLLESRLGETEILDPLAQDARRLMGKHLPELIERYERVPASYRSERDGDGLTVDERLVAGLDAAKTALDDLGRKLAHEDLSAFETKGRFIESRYKDGDEAIRSE
jgi:hypothetical protein